MATSLTVFCVLVITAAAAQATVQDTVTQTVLGKELAMTRGSPSSHCRAYARGVMRSAVQLLDPRSSGQLRLQVPTPRASCCSSTEVAAVVIPGFQAGSENMLFSRAAGQSYGWVHSAPLTDPRKGGTRLRFQTGTRTIRTCCQQSDTSVLGVITADTPRSSLECHKAAVSRRVSHRCFGGQTEALRHSSWLVAPPLAC